MAQRRHEYAPQRRHAEYVAQRMKPVYERIRLSQNPAHSRDLCIPRWWHLRVAVRATSDHRGFTLAATYWGDALMRVHRPKVDGQLGLLRQTLVRASDSFHAQVAALPNRTLTLYYSISDWINTQRALLPVIEQCTSASSTGFPFPDFTFYDYPAIRPEAITSSAAATSPPAAAVATVMASAHHPRARGDWPTALALLGNVHRTRGTRNRTPTIVWRGSAQHQPFNNANLPPEHRYRRSYVLQAMNSLAPRLATLGVAVDVHATDAQLGQRARDRKLTWPQMCAARYQLHVDGYSYAAALKYRLA